MIEIHLSDPDEDERHEEAVYEIADEVVLTLKEVRPCPNNEEVVHCILALERVMACMIHVRYPGSDWKRVIDIIAHQLLRRLKKIDINLAKDEVKH